MMNNDFERGKSAIYILLGLFFGSLQSVAGEKKGVYHMVGDVAVAIIVSVLTGWLSEYRDIPVPLNRVLIGIGALLGRNLLDLFKALALNIAKQQIKTKTGIDPDA